MTEKKFEINEILEAIKTISKIERKKTNIVKKNKNLAYNGNYSANNNEIKSNKTEILVLDQMIE